MRLTPFRIRSSVDTSSDERTQRADAALDGELPPDASTILAWEEGAGRNVTTSAIVRNTNLDIATALEEVNAPVTVDELVDQLVHTDESDDFETWGDVHERLHRIDLPTLDEAGVIDFDAERGVVDVPNRGLVARVKRDGVGDSIVLVAASIGVATALLVFELSLTAMFAGVFVAALGGFAYARIR